MTAHLLHHDSQNQSSVDLVLLRDKEDLVADHVIDVPGNIVDGNQVVLLLLNRRDICFPQSVETDPLRELWEQGCGAPEALVIERLLVDCQGIGGCNV